MLNQYRNFAGPFIERVCQRFAEIYQRLADSVPFSSRTTTKARPLKNARKLFEGPLKAENPAVPTLALSAGSELSLAFLLSELGVGCGVGSHRHQRDGKAIAHF